MFWFNKKKKERIMNMIASIRPSSKMALKQQCILIARGNMDEAIKMYDFLIKDLDNIPDIDPLPKTWTDNVGETINEILNWSRKNQGVIFQGYEAIRNIFQNKNLAPTTEIPSNSPLPNINP